MRKINITNQQLGSLTSIEVVGRGNDGSVLWLCECTCGKKTVVAGYQLRNGHTSSCGNCLNYELMDDIILATDSSRRHFIFDVEDYERVSSYTWYVTPKAYVMTSIKTPYCTILHRFITRANNGQYVDHINGNPEDNRKCNLRICTNAQNAYNQKVRSNNTIGFKGVSKTHSGRYRSYINKNYRQINLGIYNTPEEAAHAYDEVATLLHGKFARTNAMLGLFDEVATYE
ncbi:hypothetical protein RyT2_11970 [Pseudolactococcus yaeyamensis]